MNAFVTKITAIETIETRVENIKDIYLRLFDGLWLKDWL